MAEIEGGFVEVNQCCGEERVIVQKTGDACFAITKSAQQSFGFRIEHTITEKSRRLLRSNAKFIVAKALGGQCEGRDHQAVPSGEPFVIQIRPHMESAQGQHLLFGIV